jgi:Secretion system C-terminal sorting domain/Leucine Rich repeats (2 copies)
MAFIISHYQRICFLMMLQFASIGDTIAGKMPRTGATTAGFDDSERLLKPVDSTSIAPSATVNKAEAIALRPFPVGLPPFLETDFRQLEALYNATNGDNWTNHTNWFTADMSTWHGVKMTCTGITNLKLENNNLNGHLPNLNLPYLDTLNLGHNLLTGNVPNLNLPNLIYLDLYNNHLTGSIPDLNCPKLRYLILANNQLTGKVPNFNCPNLIELALSVNQLSGRIPAFNFPNLQILWLKQNHFTITDMDGNAWATRSYEGEITPQALLPIHYQNNTLSMAGSTHLSRQTFKWYRNNTLVATIVGDTNYIPTETGTYFCRSTHADVVGFIAESQSFVIANCAVTHTVQTNLPLGDQLIVNGHTYTTSGTYQDTFIRSPLCDSIVITQLNVQRPFPVGLAACLENDFRQLETLYNATQGDNWVNHTNWFTADLSTWYGIKTTTCGVKTIWMEHNNLNGTLPNLNLPYLDTLNLGYSHLTGTLPNLTLPNLFYLDLYSNQLTGSIPNLNCPNLGYLILANNQLTGSIPNLNCPNLIDLALSTNQLSGRIPNFYFPKLQILWLKENKFTFADMVGNAWLTKTYQGDLSPQAPIAVRYVNNHFYIPLSGDLTKTTFEWYKLGSNTVLATTVGSSAFAPQESSAFYHFKITNTEVPDLTLTGTIQSPHCYIERIFHHTITADQRVTVNGHTYATTGIYRDTLNYNALAAPYYCDTIIITHLTVNCPITVAVEQGVNQLTCRAISNFPPYNYVWSNCSPNASVQSPFVELFTVTAKDFVGCANTQTALNRPNWGDSILCVRRDSTYQLTLPTNGLSNVVYHWYRNQQWLDSTTTPTFTIEGLQDSDTGLYKVVFTLPNLPTVSIPMMRLQICCNSNSATTFRTIRAGTSVFWGGIECQTTGIYGDTLAGANYLGCDSIRLLNLTVLPCQLTLRHFSQVGTRLTALIANPIGNGTYKWSTGAVTSGISVTRSGTYQVTITDSLGCTVSADTTITLANSSYRLLGAAIGCQSAGSCTPILLTRNISNINGYTIRLKFDSTKIQPAPNHTWGSVIQARDSAVLYQQVIRDTLILTIGLQGGYNLSGGSGDTLICIAWRLAASIDPNQLTANLTGFVEESMATGGQNVCAVYNMVQIVPEGALMFNLFYQGSSPMNSSTDANPTYVLTGKQGAMQQESKVVNSTGGFLLSPWRNDSIQFSRKSLRSVGIPEISGNDAYVMSLVVARHAKAEKNIFKLLSMDVNGDGLINSGDITAVLRRIIYYQTGFIQANFRTDTVAWRHFPKAYLTERASFKLSTKYPDDDQVGISRLRVPKIEPIFHPQMSINCNAVDMPIVAILLGDADGSLTMNGTNSKGKWSTSVTIDAKNSLRNQDTFRIPIYASEQMKGFDCIIDHYSKQMEIISVASASPKVVAQSNIDEQTKQCFITGFSADADGIAPNQPLYYITVKTACIDNLVFGTVTPYLNGVLAHATVQTTCNVPTQEINLEEITVFPNPTTNWLTITYNQLPDNIQLFNIMGTLLKNIEPTMQQTKVDLSDLQQGIYLFKIKDKMFKIIKQ